MIVQATKQGLRAAAANWKLIATIWLLNVLLALAAALPGWAALSNAMGSLPLSDSLASAFSFGVLADLEELSPGLVRGFAVSGVVLFILGLLASFAVAGGALEMLSHSDGRGYAERFGAGAFRFYGRFLRLGIATLLLAALTAGILAGQIFALRGWVRREHGSEVWTLTLLAVGVLVAGLMLLLALLAQDAARVMIVRDEVRGVLRALWRGVRLVWRHPFAWLGTWGVNGLLLLAAFALYLLVADALGAAALLVLVVLMQQLFVFVRCTLRVALTGAELALVPVPAVPHLIEETPVEERFAEVAVADAESP